MTELRIKPIKNQPTASRVLHESKMDGHLLFQPSHYVEKAGEIIGGFALCSAPILHFWMHTTKASARDSLMAFQTAENIASAAGQNVLITLCKESSPFFPFLQRLGYTNLGTMIISSKILL